MPKYKIIEKDDIEYALLFPESVEFKNTVTNEVKTISHGFCSVRISPNTFHTVSVKIHSVHTADRKEKDEAAIKLTIKQMFIM